MTPEQLTEFAMGLANSKHHFLWIIRPDLVQGESAILPPERDSRCPQEGVLNHPSVGGFLTHSGWGSTVESLSCWCSNDLLAICDQQMNCRYSCSEWGVGMEIDNNVKSRDEVEKLVRKLMVGEKGKKMKENAMEW
ncbi:LOW QUALITY PROTEIN: hypothetical protein Tsubulata_046169, partial [Turnera subulata]